MPSPRWSARAPALLALAASLTIAGGCAHTQAQAQAAELAEERGSELAQLRRENAGLRDRVANLEERVRLLEQGGAELAWDGGEAVEVGETEWTSPIAPGEQSDATAGDGPRQLPLVKLEPRRTSNGGRLAARPAEAETEQPARVLRQTGSISLSQVPNSGYEDPADAYDEVEVEDDAPAYDDGSMQSYRLVGSKLVEATKAKPQISTGKRDRDSGVVSDYEQAMDTYRDGRYADAEAAFQAIVKSHPNHEYADNALYWQGEAAYDQAHYADALAAFTTVVERYGGGGKAPDALLKIGLCYGRLGDSANARDVLTQLIAAYPRSDASKIAKRKLDELSE